MHVWGLHLLDLSIILLFLIALLVVGYRVSRSVKGETDFYLGGRKLGRKTRALIDKLWTRGEVAVSAMSSGK